MLPIMNNTANRPARSYRLTANKVTVCTSATNSTANLNRPHTFNTPFWTLFGRQSTEYGIYCKGVI